MLFSKFTGNIKRNYETLMKFKWKFYHYTLSTKLLKTAGLEIISDTIAAVIERPVAAIEVKTIVATDNLI